MCPKEGTKAIENVVIGKWVCAQSYLTLVTPWTVACQDPLFMEFSRQECWSGLPFPSPGDLPQPRIELRSPALQADSLPAELICLLCRRPGFDPWVGKIPWRRKWQTTPAFLPRKSYGEKSLGGYSPWDHKNQTQLSD